MQVRSGRGALRCCLAGRAGGQAEVTFDLRQGAVLGLGYLPVEVDERDESQEAEQEERAIIADGAQQGEEGDADDEVRAQLAMVATPIARPRILTG